MALARSARGWVIALNLIQSWLFPTQRNRFLAAPLLPGGKLTGNWVKPVSFQDRESEAPREPLRREMVAPGSGARTSKWSDFSRRRTRRWKHRSRKCGRQFGKNSFTAMA